MLCPCVLCNYKCFVYTKTCIFKKKNINFRNCGIPHKILFFRSFSAVFGNQRFRSNLRRSFSTTKKNWKDLKPETYPPGQSDGNRFLELLEMSHLGWIIKFTRSQVYKTTFWAMKFDPYWAPSKREKRSSGRQTSWIIGKWSQRGHRTHLCGSKYPLVSLRICPQFLSAVSY